MMKTLTKLALVSAMAMSSSAFAMQALDDSDLSQTTGQDGITIKLDAQPDGTIFGANDIVVHDNDGLGNTHGITATGAGAIVLGKNSGGTGTGFSIKGNAGDAVVINVDADSNGTSPVLNVNIGLPAALTVHTGDIYVAKSGGIAAAAGSQFSSEAKILNDISIGLGGATMNVQLGNAPQGAMIALGGSVAGGINIGNLELKDNSAGGQGVIHINNINVANAGAADLSLATQIGVTPDGLDINYTGGNVDVRLTGVQLGTADTAHQIGDVAILGMAVPHMTVSGH